MVPLAVIPLLAVINPLAFKILKEDVPLTLKFPVIPVVFKEDVPLTLKFPVIPVVFKEEVPLTLKFPVMVVFFKEVAPLVQSFLSDPSFRSRHSEASLRLVSHVQGASRRTAEAIYAFLSSMKRS